MDGLLLIDKPADWTSHDVVAKLRHLLNMRRIGHAGTLDPFATGLLLIGVGKGTKALHHLTGVDKTYEARVELGVRSTTFDPEGELTRTIDPKLPTTTEIEQALDLFRGGYDQRAPLFSAKKRQGVPLYELARRGEAEETMRPVKHVEIFELTILNYTWPILDLRIRCGSGTYIRSLGDDLGNALAVGGYVTALRRTKIGDFSLNQAISWQPLPTGNGLEQALIPTPVIGE